MKVTDVMSTPPVTCGLSSTLSEAAAEMWRHDCGALPVVDDNGVAVGMVTDRDICIAVGTRAQRACDVPVSSVITGHLSYVHPDDDLSRALETIERDRIHRLPVLDDDRHVVGVVALNDLILRAGEHPADEALTNEHVLGALKKVSSHWLPMPVEHVGATESAPAEARRPWRAGQQPEQRRASRKGATRGSR